MFYPHTCRHITKLQNIHNKQAKQLYQVDLNINDQDNIREVFAKAAFLFQRLRGRCLVTIRNMINAQRFITFKTVAA